MNMHFTTTTRKTGPRVSFPYKGGVHFVSPENIIRLEADSNYTYIHIQNQKPILMAKVLADYEAMLEPFGFVRTHRSHLINKQHVANVNLHQIVMDDNSKADISRRKRKGVLQTLIHFSTAA